MGERRGEERRGLSRRDPKAPRETQGPAAAAASLFPDALLVRRCLSIATARGGHDLVRLLWPVVAFACFASPAASLSRVFSIERCKQDASQGRARSGRLSSGTRAQQPANSHVRCRMCCLGLAASRPAQFVNMVVIKVQKHALTLWLLACCRRGVFRRLRQQPHQPAAGSATTLVSSSSLSSSSHCCCSYARHAPPRTQASRHSIPQSIDSPQSHRSMHRGGHGYSKRPETSHATTLIRPSKCSDSELTQLSPIQPLPHRQRAGGPKEEASGGASKGVLACCRARASSVGWVGSGLGGGQDHSNIMIEQWIETLRRGECIKEHELKKLCNLVR